MMLIGIAGRKLAGKSELAKIIVAKLGSGAQVTAFAAPIKWAVVDAYGLTIDEVNAKDTVVERWGKTPRQMFQEIGTFYRDRDEDHWVKHLAHRLQHRQGFVYVVDDVRFPNEVEWIRSQGGVVVHVESRMSPWDEHVSENSLDGVHFDYTVVNTVGAQHMLYPEAIGIINLMQMRYANAS